MRLKRYKSREVALKALSYLYFEANLFGIKDPRSLKPDCTEPRFSKNHFRRIGVDTPGAAFSDDGLQNLREARLKMDKMRIVAL